MNPQYVNPVGARGSFVSTYPRMPQQNTYNGYETHGISENMQPMNKRYSPAPYGNPALQNGPSANFQNNPGQISNQSISQVQSASVPPNNEVSNQLSNDMNCMHLSQGQNHLMPGGPAMQRLSGSDHYPPSPTPISSNQSFHQPPQPVPTMNQFPGVPPNSNGHFKAPPQAMHPPPSGNTNYHPSHSPQPFYSTQYGDQQAVPRDAPGAIPTPQLPVSEGYHHPQPQQQKFNVGGPPMPYGSNMNGPPQMMQDTQYGPPPGMQTRFQGPPQPPNGVQSNVQPPMPQYSQPAPTQNRVGALPQPPVQNRRLDPDNMPSPIQVIEDDRKLRSNSFVTNQRGVVPPLVTTEFTVFDEGLCSPRFMRSTIYSVPVTAEMLKQTSVPFALAISPFARQHEKETPPPISELGDRGPVRCNRCKAYMCPFMQFIDSGRRFQCVFCKTTSEVPPEYFCHLDHMGERTDRFNRPELCLGSYEFIANKEYCKNSTLPNSPAFVFLIDVSYNSIRSGMVKILCENMKQVLSELPRDGEEKNSKIRVGFITYSTVVHFYNISGNLIQPQMLVVSDVQDMFMPLLEGFLVNISEAEHVIDSLLEQIPLMFSDSKETETILGPAIQAGLEALKAADCTGKLFVFHSSLPIAEAPGKLRNRDDRKLLGTDKEKTILSPQNTFYNNLGQECVVSGCCVDLFLFPNAYIDVATIGQVCRLSGGQIFKYTYFQADIDGKRFIEDLKKNIGKPIGFDVVIRVRTSTGIRPTEFTGNFFMSNTTDVELGAIDCDKSISVEIKYDDKLPEEEGVYIQTAVLFTSCGGQRKLRIHNLALNPCSQMAELFRNCELDTIMNIFLKEGVRMIAENSPKHVKDHFVSRSAQILACYRKNCAQVSSAGQLILPECMKLLPLYINCLIKSDALSGGQEMSTDDRSFIMMAAYSMDVDSSAAYLYPRLLPIHDINPKSDLLPTAIRCSVERLKDTGIYLIENGISMFLWIGINASMEWIQDVFGVQAVERIDIEKTELLQFNTPLSKRLKDVIDKVQMERSRCMKLHIVRQGDKLELLFRQLLVEDRTTEGSTSYVDFLCHLHKEIRSLLS